MYPYMTLKTSDFDNISLFIRQDHAHVQTLFHALGDLLPLTAIGDRIVEGHAVVSGGILHLCEDLAQLDRQRLFAAPLDALHIDDPAFVRTVCIDDAFLFDVFPAMFPQPRFQQRTEVLCGVCLLYTSRCV